MSSRRDRSHDSRPDQLGLFHYAMIAEDIGDLPARTIARTIRNQHLCAHCNASHVNSDYCAVHRGS